MHNVSILHDIRLSLLLAVLGQLVLICRIGDQSVCVDHLGIYETFGEVRVDLSPCLDCTFPLSDGPSPHFVSAYSIEMCDLKLFVACFYDTIYF